MNIHEHQAKELLKKFGAPVSKGVVIYNLNESLGFSLRNSYSCAFIFVIFTLTIAIFFYSKTDE